MPGAWILCKFQAFYVIILEFGLTSKVKDDAITSFLLVFIQKVVFLRGNLVGMGHYVPAVAEAFLSVRCSLPSSIVIIVDEPGTFSIIP